MKNIYLIICLLFLYLSASSQNAVNADIVRVDTVKEIATKYDIDAGLADITLDTIVYTKVLFVDKSAASKYTTIQAAIDDASDGDLVMVHPGVYTITTKIETKNGVDLYFDKGAEVNSSTITNCIEIDSDTLAIVGLSVKSSGNTPADSSIIWINNSKVKFLDLYIDQASASCKTLYINNSNVSGDIRTYANNVTKNIITIDSSSINIKSDELYGQVYIYGNSTGLFDIKKHINAGVGITTNNTSDIEVNILSNKVLTTGGGELAGGERSVYTNTFGNSKLILTAQKLRGGTVVCNSSQFTMSNTYQYGSAWNVISDNADNARMYINNCVSKLDLNDVDVGSHSFETGGPNRTNEIYINGGTYECTGGRGDYVDMSSVFELDHGTLYAYNATFIDHGSSALGYKMMLKLDQGKAHFHNCVFDVGNDGMKNYFAQLTTGATADFFDLRLFNCTVKGKSLGTGFFYYSNTATDYTVSDTLMISNTKILLNSPISSSQVSNRITFINNDAISEGMFQPGMGNYFVPFYYTKYDSVQPKNTDGDTLDITITLVDNVYTKPMIISKMYIFFGTAYNTAGMYILENFTSVNQSTNALYTNFVVAKLSERTNTGNWVIPGTFTLAYISGTILKISIPNNATAVTWAKVETFNMENVKSISLTRR